MQCVFSIFLVFEAVTFSARGVTLPADFVALEAQHIIHLELVDFTGNSQLSNTVCSPLFIIERGIFDSF